MMAPELRSLLRDMLDNARLARQFLGARTLENFQGDIGVIYQVAHAIEIVGEAASQAVKFGGVEIRTLPWKDMINIRNKLAHGYRTLRADILFLTVRDDLPPLIAELERILNESTSNG